MHIPPDVAAVHSISLDAGVNNKRSADAQRAKEIRKRLLHSPASLDDDPDAILLIGQWLGECPAEPLSGDHYTPASDPDPDPDLD